MNLVIVGGTVVDVIFCGLRRLPSWPEHTEFTPANLVQTARAPLVTLGGNGANAAFVAARGGARVTLHTALANDAPGGLARGWLEGAGCRVRTTGGSPATAVNVTATNPRHRRATLFYPGSPVPLPCGAAWPRGVRAVLVCGWPHPPLPAIAEAFAALRARRVLTAFDPGPLLGRAWTLATLQPLLGRLDLLLANDHELRTIARADDLATALRRFRRVFAGHVIAKCGGDGAWWLPAGSEKPRAFRCRRVRVKNTVGAGDAFNGALLARIVRGAAYSSAINAANRAAGGVVASARGVLGARRGRGR